jgi:hypothetical protein
VAEGNALLKRHTVSSCIEGSNPSLSATQRQNQGLGVLSPESDRETGATAWRKHQRG